MTPEQIRQASHGLTLRAPGETMPADIRADLAKLWPAAAAKFIGGATVIEATEGVTEA